MAKSSTRKKNGARGNLHIVRDNIVHGEQSIKCVSDRAILVVERITKFSYMGPYVNATYLQSDRPLISKIFKKIIHLNSIYP